MIRRRDYYPRRRAKGPQALDIPLDLVNVFFEARIELLNSLSDFLLFKKVDTLQEELSGSLQLVEHGPYAEK